MFFLDAFPTKLLKRFEERDELEMFDTLDDLVKVRKKALLLAESWNIIDTTGTVEATFSHIENVLEKIDNKT